MSKLAIAGFIATHLKIANPNPKPITLPQPPYSTLKQTLMSTLDMSAVFLCYAQDVYELAA